MNKINFNEWVSKNNIDNLNKKYSKGWWEYIDFIRRLESKVNGAVFVVGNYEVNTPPPEETIVLPIILLEVNNYKFYLKEDFSYSSFFDQWMISIESDKEIMDLSNHLSKIKSKEELIEEGFKSLFHDKLIKDFKNNNLIFMDNGKQISGTVSDELDLYALIKLVLAS